MKKIITSNGKPLIQDGKVFLSDGGGGGAVIKTEGGWQGTAVPESGLVDKVYFNTNLSVEEVVEIVKNLNYLFFDGLYVSVCFTDAPMQQVIVIIKIPASEIGTTEDVYLMQVSFDQENPYYFQTIDIAELGWVGWNPNITGVIDVNMENILSAVAPQVGYIPENNNLSKILSSTPFVKSSGEPVSLSGEYDGSSITIKNLSCLWKVSPVPETGLIKKVYFNTNLSVEEVVEILETLNFVPFEEGIKIWSCVTDETMANGIGILKIESAVEGKEALYTITVNINGETQIAFATGTGETDGWAVDFTGVAEFNIENQITTLGLILGLTPENEKASMLFSIESGIPYTIDLEPYLAEQKLPLKFKINKDYIIPNEFITINENGEYDVTKYKTATINVPFTEIEIKSDISTTGVIPNTGFVSTIFLNRNLGASEVENLMDKVTYVTYNNVQEYYVFYKDSSTYIVFEIESNVKRIRYRLNYGEIVMYDSSQGGWRRIADSYKYYVFNAEAVSKIDAFLNTPSYKIGIDNSKIIRLLSISPLTFRLYPTIELEGKYTGTSMLIDDRTEVDILKMMEEDKTIPLHIMATVKKPTGTKTITVNGSYDVAGYKTADVNVPIPDGYIKPEGTIEINTTADIDVTNYATAKINEANLSSENIRKGKTVLGIKGDALTVKDFIIMKKNCDGLLSRVNNNSDVNETLQFDDTKDCISFARTFAYNGMVSRYPLINTSNGIIFEGMYIGCGSSLMTETKFPSIDTSNGTNFKQMYCDCLNATVFPFLDTSKGTDFSYMYYRCSKATTFPALDTSNGTSLNYMFYGCTGATSIPALDTSKGINYEYMFYNCKKIKKIDITRFNSHIIETYPDVVTASDYMFGYCHSLKAIIFRSFGSTYYINNNSFIKCYHILGTVDETYNPNGDQDCYIYVPRNMIATLSDKAIWLNYASQLRALEDYTVDGTTTGEFDDAKAGLI